MNATSRIWRTFLQGIAALAVFVPAALKACEEAGYPIQGAPAIGGLVVLGATLAAMFQNTVIDPLMRPRPGDD